MSKSSNKKKIKQLKIWLSQEIYFGKGKNNPKSKNYVSRFNDKQLIGRKNDRKNDKTSDPEGFAKRIQEYVDANEEKSRYRRKGKSVGNYIGLH